MKEYKYKHRIRNINTLYRNDYKNIKVCDNLYCWKFQCDIVNVIEFKFDEGE